MENPFEIINNRLNRIENLLENICLNIEKTEGNDSHSKIMDINQFDHSPKNRTVD